MSATIHKLRGSLGDRQLFRLLKFLDNSPLALGASSNGKVVYVTESTSRLFGYSASDFPGRIHDLVQPEHHAKLTTKLNQPTSAPYSMKCLTKIGEQINVLVLPVTIDFGSDKLRLIAIKSIEDVAL